MAWTAPRTWVAAAVLTAAQLNTDIRDNMLWLGTRKGFFISKAAAQSIPNSVATAISFDTETTDTDNFGAVPATTYTVPSGLDGMYAITGTVTWAANPGAASLARILAGGVQVDGGANSTVGLNGSATATIPLAATNTVGLTVFQNSGGAVNATATLRCFWVGR